MFLDVGLLSKGTATHDTLKRLFPRVCPQVLLEVKVLGEQLVAVLTLKRASLLFGTVTAPRPPASPASDRMTVHCHPCIGCCLGLRRFATCKHTTNKTFVTCSGITDHGVDTHGGSKSRQSATYKDINLALYAVEGIEDENMHFTHAVRKTILAMQAVTCAQVQFIPHTFVVRRELHKMDCFPYQ